MKDLLLQEKKETLNFRLNQHKNQTDSAALTKEGKVEKTQSWHLLKQDTEPAVADQGSF